MATWALLYLASVLLLTSMGWIYARHLAARNSFVLISSIAVMHSGLMAALLTVSGYHLMTAIGTGLAALVAEGLAFALLLAGRRRGQQ